jgi:Fur family peroxide stress response transcriptional regulator
MNRPPGELKRMLERFVEVIRRAGVKMTPQRLEIYRETARTDDHPHLETIYRNVRGKMPGVSLDTVYRTLDLFRELGLVTTTTPIPHRVRFDANMSPHHHFVCRSCGMTRDFHDSDLDTLEVPESARTFGRVESVHIEVRGLCPACSTSKNKNRMIGTRSHRIIKRRIRRD